ncbi:hypothetical protein TGDOM2_400090, partial [Toxoplasma gondii GAB2-2007-GAL-DOM2]
VAHVYIFFRKLRDRKRVGGRCFLRNLCSHSFHLRSDGFSLQKRRIQSQSSQKPFFRAFSSFVSLVKVNGQQSRILRAAECERRRTRVQGRR